MRRRAPERIALPGDVPPELAIGRCIEVWSENPRPKAGDISSHARWTRAWRAHCDDLGLDMREQVNIQPKLQMWSARFLAKNDRKPEVDQRLASAGVTVDDLPALREAAINRLDDLKGTR